MRRALVLGLLALGLAPAFAFAFTPRSETSRSGAVRATLTYRQLKGDRFPPVSRMRVRIFRNGLLAADRLVKRDCPECGSPEHLGANTSIKALDLEGDHEPEIIVRMFTGGAHCCSVSLIYRFAPGAGYSVTKRVWGDPSFSLADLTHDGTLQFVTGDDRFAYAFTSYADSVLPIQIFSYRAGKLLAVTPLFHRLVVKDLRQVWALYLVHRGDRSVKGVLAAYLADKYVLGQGADGWRRVMQAYHRGELSSDCGFEPCGRAYLKKLREFLVQTGYIR